MTVLGSLSSWSPLRRALVAGVVAAAFAAGGVLTVASESGPPTFSGGYGSWEAFADPQPVPTIDFLDPDGGGINLDSFAGQTVLVNFWATWCAPCVKELPALDALQKDLGGEDFQVVIISIDRKGHEVAQPFLDDLGIENLKTYADPKGAVARAMQATGLPTTLMVSSDGMVLGRLLGDAEWNSGGAKDLVRYYLR